MPITVTESDEWPTMATSEPFADLVRHQAIIHHIKVYWRWLSTKEVEYIVDEIPDYHGRHKYFLGFLVGMMMRDDGHIKGVIDTRDHILGIQTRLTSDKPGWRLSVVTLLFRL